MGGHVSPWRRQSPLRKPLISRWMRGMIREQWARETQKCGALQTFYFPKATRKPFILTGNQWDLAIQCAQYIKYRHGTSKARTQESQQGHGTTLKQALTYHAVPPPAVWGQRTPHHPWAV
eukprot:1160175-Pelagomonas_calceolata.AAC.5